MMIHFYYKRNMNQNNETILFTQHTIKNFLTLIESDDSKVVEKQPLSYHLDVDVNWYNTFFSQFVILVKTSTTFTLWQIHLQEFILLISHTVTEKSKSRRIPWVEEPGRLQSMGREESTRLRGLTFTFHFHALGKEMATHSSVLAWRIPGTEEPGGLPSMGSHRVGHD